MRYRNVAKAVAVSISLLSAVLMSGPSVARLYALASEERAIPAGESGEIPAQERLSGAARRRITLKPITRKRTLALPEAQLLAVVQQDDITHRHQALSDAVLRALPAYCRTYLKNYYVRYDRPERRGLGGQTTIILDGSVPDAEFISLLIHECAHVTHGNMSGNAASGESSFKDGKQIFYNDAPVTAFFGISWKTENVRRQGTTKADFASGYAQSDAFEDFAETFALYVLHRDAFEERALENPAMAAKLRWMNTYLPMTEESFGRSSYAWDAEVPWDVTRLPFRLNARLTE